MNDTNTDAAIRHLRGGSVPRSWRMAIVLLLTVSWTRPAAGEDATPREPRGETGRQTLITVSRETTFFTEPLDDEGFPDLLAALDEKLSRGVTPENNAAVPLVRAPGAELPAAADLRKEFYRRLGIVPPASDERRFLEFFAWTKGGRGGISGSAGMPGRASNWRLRRW